MRKDVVVGWGNGWEEEDGSGGIVGVVKVVVYAFTCYSRPLHLDKLSMLRWKKEVQKIKIKN